MIAAASAPSATVRPFEIFRCNVERIRLDFPSLYPQLLTNIRDHKWIVVEGP